MYSNIVNVQIDLSVYGSWSIMYLSREFIVTLQKCKSAMMKT